MPKYLVETISIYRMRYVVDCANEVHAEDTVVMNEAEEFSQKHIAENNVSCREISDDEIRALFVEDHPYLTSYGSEKSMEYVHVVDYTKE